MSSHPKCWLLIFNTYKEMTYYVLIVKSLWHIPFCRTHYIWLDNQSCIKILRQVRQDNINKIINEMLLVEWEILTDMSGYKKNRKNGVTNCAYKYNGEVIHDGQMLVISSYRCREILTGEIWSSNRCPSEWVSVEQGFWQIICFH